MCPFINFFFKIKNTPPPTDIAYSDVPSSDLSSKSRNLDSNLPWRPSREYKQTVLSARPVSKSCLQQDLHRPLHWRTALMALGTLRQGFQQEGVVGGWGVRVMHMWAGYVHYVYVYCVCKYLCCVYTYMNCSFRV